MGNCRNYSAQLLEIKMMFKFGIVVTLQLIDLYEFNVQIFGSNCS